MTDTAELRRHAALVDGTASRLGMDLQEAAIRGALRFDEISEAVLRCTTCTRPDACELWLADGGGEAQQPPIYCRNTTLLRRLRGPH